MKCFNKLFLYRFYIASQNFIFVLHPIKEADGKEILSYHIMSSQPKLVYGQGELASVIALYESYMINVQSNLVSEKQMNQKGEMFLSWVNDLLGAKLRSMNQITERSIEIFKQISIDQVEISARIIELEQDCAQKNTVIENHLYTIKNIESKLTERQNDIYKMKQEISELTEKIEKQEHTFKRETKQFKKTFRIIQQNTESDKQIFDSIQMEYEYEKAQKDIIKDQLEALIQQKAVFIQQLDDTKRLLRASQNKLEWEIKKKISLEDIVKQKNLMIEKLIHQIQDLKETIKDPYEGIQQDHMDQKQIDELISVSKQLDKNILSQQMALRQSFFSEADLDEDLIRRNSFRKSFDQGPVNPSQNQFQYPVTPNQNNNALNIRKTENTQDNITCYREKTKSNKSSLHQDHIQQKVEEKPALTKANRSVSPKSILIKDMQKSPVGSFGRSQRKSPLKSSPQVTQFQTDNVRQKQDELQIITQKVQSETQSSTGPFRRHVPDLYFAHFLLTSQAVKIKEDCQEILNIDVKQYYQQIIEKRVPMHIWDDWVRDKLRIAVKNIKSKHQADRRRQNSRIQP